MSVSVLKSVGDHARVVGASSSSPLVLLFSSAWHPPCKQMRAVVDTLAQQFTSTQFAELDAEEVGDVTEKYDIESVPTTLIIKNGNVVGKLQGANPAELTALVNQHCSSSSSPSATATSSTSSSSSSSSSSAASVVDGDLNSRLHRLINGAPVMLFIKGTPDAPRCGFTKQMLALMKEQGIVGFGSFNILDDNTVREGLKKYSNWPTYPQMYVNGELIGGLDVAKEMAASGELRAMVPPTHLTSTAASTSTSTSTSNVNDETMYAHFTTTGDKELDRKLYSLITSHRVMLFMKGSPSNPQCGFSNSAVSLLREVGCTGGDLGSFDIFSDTAVREGLKTFAKWPTFPQLYIDGELVGGLDVMQALKQEGQLQDMLQKK